MSTTYNEGQEIKPEEVKDLKVNPYNMEHPVDKDINDYIICLGFKKVSNNKYTLDVGFKVFEILVLTKHLFISAVDEITGKERPILHLYRYGNVDELDHVIKRLSSLEPFITGGYFS